MKRASFSPRRPRIVHAVVLGLLCTAMAVPVLANLDPQTNIVTVPRGYISAERPIDRLLRGDALGSRQRIAPVAVPPARIATLPRIVTPTRLDAPAADAAPDLNLTRLTAPPAKTPPTEPAATQPREDAPKTEVQDTAVIDASVMDPAPAPVIQAVMDVEQPPAFPLPRPKPERVTALKAPEPLVLEAAPDSVAIALPSEIETAELAALPAPAPAPAPAPVEAAPRIALVVTAAGIHEGTTRKAIDALPDSITLAFAPIGKKTGDLARAAIADGHTILAEVPMEPMNPRRDPGEPLTLRVGNTGADNIDRLDKALARVPGASGVSSYLGARFSRSDAAATPVIGEIAARGLFLFENQPNGQSRLATLARKRDLPYAASAMSIDTDRDAVVMLDRLTALESQARRDGIAIGVATTYRETIATLEKWVGEAQERGVVFVPVTRIDDAG